MGDRLGIHGAVDILLFLSSGLRSIFGFSEEMHPRQEVCIKSVLAACSPVTSLQLSPYVFFSQKPSSLFMTNERQPSVLLLSVLRLKVKSSINMEKSFFSFKLLKLLYFDL